jgi:restriction system protein
MIDGTTILNSQWTAAKTLLPLWGPLVALLILKAAYKWVIAPWLRRIGRLPDFDRLNSMSGIEFERALRQIFERDGWRVELTPRSGDFGADLVLSKPGKRLVVQAKRWRRPVGIRAVQEALGARDRYRADEAWVVTQSTFSRAARAQAEASRVTLKDGEWLASEIWRLSERVKKVG